jgi:hypothetical protein
MKKWGQTKKRAEKPEVVEAVASVPAVAQREPNPVMEAVPVGIIGACPVGREVEGQGCSLNMNHAGGHAIVRVAGN